MTRTAAGSNGLLRVAGRGRWTPEEEQRKLEGSEGRSAHRGAACRRPARPRCRPQSRTALPPRSAAPGPAAAPCAPPYGRSKLHRRPSEPLASDTALRRHACVSPTLSMRALPARTPCERHLNPSEPAGGSLLPPPPPPARGAAAPPSLVVQPSLISLIDRVATPIQLHTNPTQDRYAATNGVCADNPVQCTGLIIGITKRLAQGGEKRGGPLGPPMWRGHVAPPYGGPRWAAHVASLCGVFYVKNAT